MSAITVRTVRITVKERVWEIDYSVWNSETDTVRPDDIDIESVRDESGEEVELSRQDIHELELCRLVLETW